MTPTHFYVWDDYKCDWFLVPIHAVRCECGNTSEEMALDELPTNRNEWILTCECGEQFYNTND